MLARLSLLFVSMMLVASSGLRDARLASPAGGLLVVANQKDHTLLVVDPENRRELAKISVGVNGHEVIVSKDGRFAYVPIYGNAGVGRPGTDGSTIDVIDLQERKLAATIDLGKPLRPHRAELGPDGLLYVTAELANAVGVIDPSTRKLLAEIPTGEPQSHCHDSRGKECPAHFHLTGWPPRLHPRSRCSPHRGHRDGYEQNYKLDRIAGRGVCVGADSQWALVAGRQPWRQSAPCRGFANSEGCAFTGSS